MQRKTGYNQFPHPEVLSATADPIFFLFQLSLYSQMLLRWLKKKKPKQTVFLHNNFIRQVVTRR